MDFLTLARERYSCRKLSEREVEQEKLDKIIEAAMLAPTAVNYQPVKIWVLQSPEAVAKAASTTRYSFGAQVILAVGGSVEEAWRRKFDGKSFADIDASIVATHMMLEIQDLGLGTTWVGAFDEAKLKELFPEMEGYAIVALFPLGYPAEDAVPAKMHGLSKSRNEMTEVL